MSKDPSEAPGLPAAGSPSPEMELELRRYQLSILAQATKDMVGERDPAALLESFLLTAMGAVGAVMGFNLVLPAYGGASQAGEDGRSCAVDVHLAARGLSPEERRALTDQLDSLQQTLPAAPQGAAQTPTQLVIRDAPAAEAAFPATTALVLGWKAGSGRSGFFGLGVRLSGAGYDADTTDFLQNLLQVFVQALENACAAQTISRLNRELQRNNDALHQALRQARDSQARLDRRVYQLRTLYDAATELSPLQDANAIMNTFVLILMGALGVESCFFLLHDAADDSVLLAQRGVGPQALEVSPAAAKQMLFACIAASTFRELTPLSMQLLPADVLQNAAAPIASPGKVALLRVDENLLGMLLLGQRIASAPLQSHAQAAPQAEEAEEEAEALGSLCHNVMLMLRSARSFATITRLNQDLEARNRELQRTLEELTASRTRIEVLEHAGARLRGMLQRHAARIGRVSVWDFVCILAASVALGLFFNMSNPNGVALLPEAVTAEPTQQIAPDMAQEMLRTNPAAVLVDARPAAFYEQGHAAGSLNMPPSLFDFIYSMRFASSPEDPLFIIYGRTISRLYDEEIARRLKSQGHGQVLLLQGGLEAWTENGGKVEQGA